MRLSHAAICVIALTLVQCKTGDGVEPDASTIRDDETLDAVPLFESLPMLKDEAAFLEAATRAAKKGGLSVSQAAKYGKRIARYMAFLGVEPESTKAKTIMSRLMSGSTQFLACDKPLDWACLEADPIIRPASAHRRDTSPDIGKPRDLAGSLDFEYFLTNQWDVELNQVEANGMLARQLGMKIQEDGKKGIWMSLYGIDDIDGWMKPVYSALVEKVEQGVPVHGVFDTEGVRPNPAESTPLEYSLQPSASPRWIFGEQQAGKYNIAFQYSSTVELIKRMNKAATSAESSPARIEWPDDGIMHNKFLVLKSDERYSVWTGTANVSETCMGSERNSNMAIYIRNDDIAKTFKDEFDEMYAFREGRYEDPELRNVDGASGVQIGRFHRNKTANTQRYFRFEDGTDVHVHFAPTDDGEHRIIQPLLLNARAGDEIRVSMFGGAGLELVRAFQLAVARGANVKIILDTFTGSNSFSWIKDAEANLTMPNPYNANPPGTIEVRMDGWKGMNHHKTATITRTYPTGKRAEVIIIGSQNWSKQGNDENDENMVTIVNDKVGLPAAEAFNDHFDNRLWAKSVPYDPTAAPAILPSAAGEAQSDEGRNDGVSDGE